ncbi:MAG: RNA pseudouridine synthase [Pseudomonadota bacterium]
MPEASGSTAEPNAAPCVYESPNLFVFNKPSNVSLLQDREGGTSLWDTIKGAHAPTYLVHRLDKGTSGALLVARTQSMRKLLNRAFNAREVTKFYIAWVVGHPPSGASHTIDLPLCKGRKSRYRVAGERAQITLRDRLYTVAQDRDGVTASSRFRVLAQSARHSLLLLRPGTGRTHQLRVHLSWIGYPIVGDHLYGTPDDPRQAGPRLLLHCHKMTTSQPQQEVFARVLPGADFAIRDG